MSPEVEEIKYELRVMLMDTIKKLDEATERPARLLKEAAAAKYLQVSVGTLRKWRNMNRGPAYVELESTLDDREDSSSVRYDINDLDWYVAHLPKKKRTAA